MKKLLVVLVAALFFGCDHFMPPGVQKSEPVQSADLIDVERKDILALKHLQITTISEDTLASYVMDFINVDAASKTETARSAQSTPAIAITKTTKIIHTVEIGFAETTADKRSARSVIGPGEIPFYVFTLENQQSGETGFALTCGDSRIGTVLAVVDAGSYDDDNPFLGIFYTALATYIEDTIGIYNSVTEADIENALNKINDRSIVRSVPVTDVGKHGDFSLMGSANDPDVNSTEYILKTKWHQRDPYNAVISKHFPVPLDGYIKLTGCGPLAMAQIMAFHGKKSGLPAPYSKAPGYEDILYDWDKMIAGTDNHAIAVLIREISLARNATSAYFIWLDKDGDKADKADKGGAKSATGTTKENVIKGFKNMDYKDPGSFKSYDFKKIQNSIRDESPVLAYGTASAINIFGLIIPTLDEAHYWVMDGYRAMATLIKNDKSVAAKLDANWYVHCNMGLRSGGGIGWYISGVFDIYNIPLKEAADNYLPRSATQEGYYRYDLGILTGIRPK